MPGSRGGRIQELLGDVFDEQGEQQVGIEPTSRQLGLLGRQAVDVQQALEPFGEQFDLPAQPVDGDDHRGWIGRAIQRGDEQQIVGGIERLAADAIALALTGPAGGASAAGRSARRLANRDEADREGLPGLAASAMADQHRGLCDAILGSTPEEGRQAEGASVGLQQLEGAHAQAQHEIAATPYHIEQAFGAGIAAVPDADLAALDRCALQFLGAVPVGQLDMRQAVPRKVEGQVQAPLGAPARAAHDRAIDQAQPAARRRCLPRQLRPLGQQFANQATEPAGGTLQALQQRDVRQPCHTNPLGPGTRLAQRQPARTVGQRQAQQRHWRLDRAPPNQSAARLRRRHQSLRSWQTLQEQPPPTIVSDIEIHPNLESQTESSANAKVSEHGRKPGSIHPPPRCRRNGSRLSPG